MKNRYIGLHTVGVHIGGLVQDRRNSSALAMELRLSCINPSISTIFDYKVTDWNICIAKIASWSITSNSLFLVAMMAW